MDDANNRMRGFENLLQIHGVLKKVWS
jgi:hypothetical protein